MKTTGVAVVAFARSICANSRSVIVVGETVVLISSSFGRRAAGSTVVCVVRPVSGPVPGSLGARIAPLRIALAPAETSAWSLVAA